ncbi:putative Diguanylate cyclase [Magnetospirillum sp. LM-5]|uniref:GGDEF domain-containing protein n=1 Tax=Magnetospirillum sp. LM-5 TaxID=2681466 RepID=UPI00137D7A2E|nr:GGDEF domain-containing protein [Magnetospirillum sp. LM-5]CAA7623013.1 putative Diguanylate cyclase [Magnetospirillum sp. LM-5]
MNHRKKLSWQLLRSVLSIYFSITVLITLTQMAIEYSHTRAMVQQELEGAERTFYPALATALWELNREQLDALMRGVTDLPLISSVRVAAQSGPEIRRGHDSGLIGATIEHAFDVSYHFSGEDIHLARVTFSASDTVVLQRLQVGFQMIMISAVIKSLVLATLFVLAFRRRLGLPLRDLTESVSAIDLDSLGHRRVDLRQTEDNELSRLQDAFNRMLDTLDRERRAHVETLTAVNHSLEDQVRSRTLALEQANQRLELLARTDPLTGLANRRHFMERLAVDIMRAQRTGAPLTVLAVDLDHFKQVNDRWGHAAGDDTLVNFARTALGQLRASDMLARLGGEEFVISLPDTPLHQATEVATRILEAIRAQEMETEQGRFRYTASIGATSLRQDSDDCDALLGRADAAMYRAKQSGRDRIEAE